MRLIDANEVEKDLISFKSPIEFGEVEEAYNGAIDDCIGEIKATPTLDVKPVVHAHWIKGFFADIKCSNCNFPLACAQTMIPKLNYCPHCGAKMDEEINDEQ